MAPAMADTSINWKGLVTVEASPEKKLLPRFIGPGLVVEGKPAVPYGVDVSVPTPV